MGARWAKAGRGQAMAAGEVGREEAYGNGERVRWKARMVYSDSINSKRAPEEAPLLLFPFFQYPCYYY